MSAVAISLVVAVTVWHKAFITPAAVEIGCRLLTRQALIAALGVLELLALAALATWLYRRRLFIVV